MKESSTHPLDTRRRQEQFLRDPQVRVVAVPVPVIQGNTAAIVVQAPRHDTERFAVILRINGERERAPDTFDGQAGH